MNRVLLFLAGAVLLVGGAVAVAAGVLSTGASPGWMRRSASAVMDVWDQARGWTIEVGGTGTVSVPLLLAAATLVILTVLLIVFLSTRSRGKSKTVLEVDGVGGRTTVDVNVADAILTEPLLGRPDVLSARTGAYRVGRTRAVELAVIVRPGAPLGAVVAAAEEAIREWDELLGARIPILLHLSDRRWRDTFRTATRVQ